MALSFVESNLNQSPRMEYRQGKSARIIATRSRMLTRIGLLPKGIRL